MTVSTKKTPGSKRIAAEPGTLNTFLIGRRRTTIYLLLPVAIIVEMVLNASDNGVAYVSLEIL